MAKTIDCLFIGYNEKTFEEFEQSLRAFGINSEVYRFLELNFFWYKNKPLNPSDLFNLLTKGMTEPLDPTKNLSPAIAYLGTYLDRRGYTFDYVNYFQREKDALKEKLVQEDILTIGIITTFYVVSHPIVEIIEFIRKYNRTARIIVGGPYIASQVREVDKPSLEYLFDSVIDADFYVNSSQGETTLVKIINALKNNLPLDRINNIYYKSGKGIAATPVLAEDNPLSANMVNWDLFGDKIGDHVELRTSISCPYSCSFCSFPSHAGKFQTADIKAIEQELDQLDRIGTVKTIHFFDDTFNVPVKRFKDLLRMMINKKYKFRWHSFFRCQFADRESVELMKESGCEGVFLGIESGNEQILKNMNKNANVEKYLKGIALLNEYEIGTHASFIIGFPGETTQTVEDTITFIKQSKPLSYAANTWFCSPTTPIYKEKEKYKIKGQHHDWSHSTMDAKTATNWRNKIFLSIEESIPNLDYYYNNQIIFHMKNRGLELQQIKAYLKHFYLGVREKLLNPKQKEVSDDVIRQLKNILWKENKIDHQKANPEKQQIASTVRDDAQDINVDFQLD